MKLFLFTHRYGIEQTLTYHCRSGQFIADGGMLILENEVDTTIPLDLEHVRPIVQTILFIGPDDILTVAPCDLSLCKYERHHESSLDVA